MPADLDTRIRELVVEVVESAPPAPELDLLAEPSATRARRPIAVVVIGIAVVIALVATAIAVVGRSDTTIQARGNGDTVTLSLDSIPEGVSPRTIRGIPVFLVRRGGAVTTLVADPQHVLGETELWWCPNEQIFRAPRHAETFDQNGRKLGGPSRRGLDRLSTSVSGDTVKVRLDAVIHDTGERGTLGGTLPANESDVCRDRLVAGAGNIKLALDTIPKGVSTRRLGLIPVFLVRNDDHVTVLVSSTQHMPGENVLWWCPNQHVFYSPTHGERFSGDGALLAGPAQRGLDRFRTHVRRSTLIIARGVIVGEPRGTAGYPRTVPPECADRVVSSP